MNKMDESILRWNSLYMRNLQYEVDNAKSEDERVRLQKKRDERLELINKNKPDDMPEFV